MSDYGYYGKTGLFPTDELPIKACVCGKAPMILCEYDDTPGWRETVYQLQCSCGKHGIYTSNMSNVIDGWNKEELLSNPKADLNPAAIDTAQAFLRSIGAI